MNKWISWLVAGFLLGMLIGWNLGGQGKTLDNLWDRERDGLIKMNEQMANDKSERLAACVITENQLYAIKRVEAEFVCGFKG